MEPPFISKASVKSLPSPPPLPGPPSTPDTAAGPPEGRGAERREAKRGPTTTRETEIQQHRGLGLLYPRNRGGILRLNPPAVWERLGNTFLTAPLLRPPLDSPYFSLSFSSLPADTNQNTVTEYGGCISELLSREGEFFFPFFFFSFQSCVGLGRKRDCKMSCCRRCKQKEKKKVRGNLKVTGMETMQEKWGKNKVGGWLFWSASCISNVSMIIMWYFFFFFWSTEVFDFCLPLNTDRAEVSLSYRSAPLQLQCPAQWHLTIN